MMRMMTSGVSDSDNDDDGNGDAEAKIKTLIRIQTTSIG